MSRAADDVCRRTLLSVHRRSRFVAPPCCPALPAASSKCSCRWRWHVDDRESVRNMPWATVWQHVLVRDLSVVLARRDERRIEVIVRGAGRCRYYARFVLASSVEPRRVRGTTAVAALRPACRSKEWSVGAWAQPPSRVSHARAGARPQCGRPEHWTS